jgi:hypothetical protein
MSSRRAGYYVSGKPYKPKKDTEEYDLMFAEFSDILDKSGVPRKYHRNIFDIEQKINTPLKKRSVLPQYTVQDPENEDEYVRIRPKRRSDMPKQPRKPKKPTSPQPEIPEKFKLVEETTAYTKPPENIPISTLVGKPQKQTKQEIIKVVEKIIPFNNEMINEGYKLIYLADLKKDEEVKKLLNTVFDHSKRIQGLINPMLLGMYNITFRKKINPELKDALFKFVFGISDYAKENKELVEIKQIIYVNGVPFVVELPKYTNIPFFEQQEEIAQHPRVVEIHEEPQPEPMRPREEAPRPREEAPQPAEKIITAYKGYQGQYFTTVKGAKTSYQNTPKFRNLTKDQREATTEYKEASVPHRVRETDVYTPRVAKRKEKYEKMERERTPQQTQERSERAKAAHIERVRKARLGEGEIDMYNDYYVTHPTVD